MLQLRLTGLVVVVGAAVVVAVVAVVDVVAAHTSGHRGKSFTNCNYLCKSG